VLATDPCRSRTTWSLMSMCKITVIFLPNRRSIRTLSSMCWMCMSCRLETCVFVDKGQCARKSELCWSLSSTLLVLLWCMSTSRCRCAPKKISLVNEVLVGLEWRGLIGQQPDGVVSVVPLDTTDCQTTNLGWSWSSNARDVM